MPNSWPDSGILGLSWMNIFRYRYFRQIVISCLGLSMATFWDWMASLEMILGQLRSYWQIMISSLGLSMARFWDFCDLPRNEHFVIKILLANHDFQHWPLHGPNLKSLLKWSSSNLDPMDFQPWPLHGQIIRFCDFSCNEELLSEVQLSNYDFRHWPLHDQILSRPMTRFKYVATSLEIACSNQDTIGKFWCPATASPWPDSRILWPLLR